MSRAFYLALQVKKQKQVPNLLTGDNSVSIFVANHGKSKNLLNEIGDFRKGRLFHKHCKSNGHIIDSCFEFIGHPNWYRGKKNARRFMAKTYHVASGFSSGSSTGQEINLAIEMPLEQNQDYADESVMNP